MYEEAVPWISSAFELKKVSAASLADSGSVFGRLDMMIATDLMKKINALAKSKKASPQEKHLACEVDRADTARMKKKGMLRGREIVRIIAVHVTTREDHGQVFTYQDLMKVSIKGTGKQA